MIPIHFTYMDSIRRFAANGPFPDQVMSVQIQFPVVAIANIYFVGKPPYKTELVGKLP